MQSQNDWLEILIQCKKSVRDHVHLHLETKGESQPDLGKGAGGDLMKPVDLAAEKAIVETLQHYGISFTLISEESGVKEFGETPKQYYVTVDPIDGTTNLVHGIPFYASSIAISNTPALSTVFVALVADLAHDTTYTAIKNKGAYRNGKKIASSKRDSLDDTMVGLDLNSREIREIAPKLTELIQKIGHIRHFGANALELCYVADGTTDAFVDIRDRLRTTDFAAAFLIVHEAGGYVTTPTGEAFEARLDPKQTVKFVASGNTQIQKILLNLVK